MNTLMPHTILSRRERADRRAGEVLMTLRLARGVGVCHAAARAGISGEEWSDYESGVIPIPVALAPALAAAFGVETQDLIRLILARSAAYPGS